MAKKTTKTQEESCRTFPTPTSPEAEEAQLISLAVDLARKKLMDGTASSQLICHYLDLASPKEKLRQEMMKKQNELINAKTQNLQMSQHMDEMYVKAIEAMRSYAGANQDDDEDYTYLQ